MTEKSFLLPYKNAPGVPLVPDRAYDITIEQAKEFLI